jgi:hypothetical protein
MTRKFFSLVVALLAGCSSVHQHTERLAGLPSCCSEPAEFEFIDMRDRGESSVQITEETPAYPFPDGKSHFSPFRLPPSDKAGRLLSVKTFWATTQLGRPQVFCPSATFYDIRHKNISTELLMLSYQPSQGYWLANARVPDGAHYLVLHAEARRIGNILAVSTGEDSPALFLIGPGFFFYDRGGPGQIKYVCGHTGEMKISIAQP